MQQWLTEQPITDVAYEQLRALATAIPGYLHEDPGLPQPGPRVHRRQAPLGGDGRALAGWLRSEGYTVRLRHRELDG